MKKIFTILMLFSTLAAFSQAKFTEKKAGHIFYISVPDYLQKTTLLNDAAAIQYENSEKEIYMIVIEDSKEDLEISQVKFESLKEFHDSNIVALKTDENLAVESSPKQFEKNGLKFIQSDLKVVLKEEKTTTNVSYLVTYVESPTHYYQILCWSLTPDYKKYVEDFRKIAASIRD